MIAKFIDSYIDNLFSQLNAYYDGSITIRKAKTNLDLEKISSGESNICYMSSIESLSKEQRETKNITLVETEIYFKFMIVNKDSTYQKQIFDRYLYELFRLINEIENRHYRDNDISITLGLLDVQNVSIEGANNIEDEYYKPSIHFTLRIHDGAHSISKQIQKTEAI